jgi:hypothetical protein
LNRHARRVAEVKTRKDPQRRDNDRAREAVREIGAEIWAASSDEDLDDILDAAANDRVTMSRARTIFHAVLQGRFPELPNAMAFVARIAARAATFNVISDIYQGLAIDAFAFSVFNSRPTLATAPPVAEGELPRTLYDLPTPLVEILISHHRGSVCFAALIDLAINRIELPPEWLVKRTVRAWVDGDRALLRTMASQFTGVDVPRELLGAASVVSITSVVEKHNDDERAFRDLMAHALDVRVDHREDVGRRDPDVRIQEQRAGGVRREEPTRQGVSRERQQDPDDLFEPALDAAHRERLLQLEHRLDVGRRARVVDGGADRDLLGRHRSRPLHVERSTYVVLERVREHRHRLSVLERFALAIQRVQVREHDPP